MSRRRKKNTHLPPCVYLVHGGYWYVKRGQWTHLAPEADLAGALEKYAGIVQVTTGEGLKKLIDDTMPLICRGKAKNTAAQYKIAARKLTIALQRFSDPRQVQGKHLAAIKKAMASKPNMANRVLTVARLLFSAWLEDQLVDNNPAIGIKRHHEEHRERLPAQGEYDAVYAEAGPRLQVIMELLRYGGQRTGNTLRIRESDILEEGIRFLKHKTSPPLIVKWVPGLVAAVARARALHGLVRSMFLLPSKKHGKAPDYRSVRYQWEKACEAAKVEDLHLHDLRAMSATRAEEEGKDPTKLLAHSSPQQTRRYLRGRKPKLVEGPEF